MKVSAIIQARMSSKRFPGKVLEKLKNQTILGQIITRLQKCQSLTNIVLAIPDNDVNERLRNFDEFYNIDLVRYHGNENDVLGRFIAAATQYRIKHIVRICADSPFVLPWVIDYAVAEYCRKKPDYLFTIGLPKGQNVEIISLETLKKIYKKANIEEKEHVTLYLENHPTEFNIKKLSINSLVIDTPKDLKNLKKIAKYYD